MRKLVLLIAVGGLIAAFKWLPWWGGIALIVGLAVGAKLLAGRLFQNVLMGAFQMKSAALQGARARLHGIAPAPPPKLDPEDEDEEVDGLEAEPAVYRYVDVTIEVPRGKRANAFRHERNAFKMWEPEELMLVGPDAQPGMNFEQHDDVARVYSGELFDEGKWVPLEGQKVAGTQRVRLHVGARAGVDEFKLRYYFEILKNAGSDA